MSDTAWIENYHELKAQGHPLSYIAERFGIHKETLRRRLIRAGIRPTKPERRYDLNVESIGPVVEADPETVAKVRGLVEAHAHDDADREFLLGALGLAS